MDMINNYEVITYKVGDIDKYDNTVIYQFETEVHYMNGQVHRDNDLPAVTSNHGGYHDWYQFGKPHRDNDKPALTSCQLFHIDAYDDIDVLKDGWIYVYKIWYNHGKYVKHE